MDIKIEQQGAILLIGWNRPQKYNALTLDMYHELAKAYGELQRNDELRVAVVYGEGDHFTAGLELNDWVGVFSEGHMPALDASEIDPYGLSGPALTKPVVMAVQGFCYTAGVELLLNSDIRIAADNTRFGQLEVKRGFHACGGATFRLPIEIGWANAQRYLLTGDEWTAQQAHHWGLVQEVVPLGQQLSKAMEIAQSIAKAAPLGVQGSLRSSRYTRQVIEAQAKDYLYSELKPIMASEDMQEGVRSFLERREAKFTGK